MKKPPKVPSKPGKHFFHPKKTRRSGFEGITVLLLKIVDRVFDSFFCVTDLLLGFPLDLFR